MQPSPVPQYIRNIAEWFRHETPDLRTDVRLEARRPFCRLNELKDALLVRSGLVAIVAGDGAVRRQIIALRYPDELILPFNAGTNATIEAIAESRLDIATMNAFDVALSANRERQRALTQLLGRERAIACEWIARCGLRDSAGRIAHVLCETYYRSGIDPTLEPLTLPFTQHQLAEMTGQTSVNVNRMLAQLEDRGLITRMVRNVIVKDWTELRRLGGFDPAYLA